MSFVKRIKFKNKSGKACSFIAYYVLEHGIARMINYQEYLEVKNKLK